MEVNEHDPSLIFLKIDAYVPNPNMGGLYFGKRTLSHHLNLINKPKRMR